MQVTSNGTGRHINVEDATIKTASVEIKSLVVSGKQVTLAVFRQLIEEPILDEETFELRGVPWGHVNYHSGVGCDGFKSNDHLHVIWQLGNELRRACVRKRCSNYRPPRLATLEDVNQYDAEAYIDVAVAEGWRPSNYEELRRDDGFRVSFVDGQTHRFWVGDAMYKIFNPNAYSPRLKTSEAAIEALKRSHAFAGAPLAASEWHAKYVESAVLCQGYRERYDAAYASLERLDQLFIAV